MRAILLLLLTACWASAQTGVESVYRFRAFQNINGNMLVNVSNSLFLSIPAKVVTAGDSASLSDVSSFKGWFHYWTNRSALFGITGNINVAVSGRTSSNVWYNYTNEIRIHAPITNQPALLIVWCGINDPWTTGEGAGGETIWSFVSNVWWNAKSDGFQVAGFTVQPNWTATLGTVRKFEYFNAKARAWATNIDYLIDASALLWNGADTNIMYDGWHTTSLGGEGLERVMEGVMLFDRKSRPLVANNTGGYIRSKSGEAFDLTIADPNNHTQSVTLTTNVSRYNDGTGVTNNFTGGVSLMTAGISRILAFSLGVQIPSGLGVYGASGVAGASTDTLLVRRDSAGIAATTNLNVLGNLNSRLHVTTNGTIYPTNTSANFPAAATLGVGGYWIGNSNGNLVTLYSLNGSTTVMKILAP